jgi:transcriptional regulator with XRE-family HTH domain
MDIKSIIGDNIRGFRHKRKWSQARLAEEAKVTGNYIGNIERAEQNPSVVQLFKIAKALKTKPSIFFIESAYRKTPEEINKALLQ